MKTSHSFLLPILKLLKLIDTNLPFQLTHAPCGLCTFLGIKVSGGFIGGYTSANDNATSSIHYTVSLELEMSSSK